MPDCGCVINHDLDDVCDDQTEIDGSTYYCTKPAGHIGRHTACAPGAHPLHTWEKSDE